MPVWELLLFPVFIPDHHNITIIPLGSGNFKMVEANDGGLAVSNNNGVTITLVPTKYITTQFYGIAKHPTKNEYIGGMQDNGTWRSPSNDDATDSTRYLFQIGGDGFECLWNATKSTNILGSCIITPLKDPPMAEQHGLPQQELQQMMARLLQSFRLQERIRIWYLQ